jgi:dihydropteroate synthase
MTSLEWPLRRSYACAALELRGQRFAWGERTFVAGVINVTPDSFSGDGVGADVAAAVALALGFVSAGAALLDIGGESSRPGAAPVTPEEEAARVLPALAAIRGATALPISIDTCHASVAEQALDAGADLVNDISGLRHDPAMAAVVACHRAGLIAMHNQRGRPFRDVVGDIHAGFAESLRIAAEAGIDRGRIILDPGFGFGWEPEHNLEMLRRLPELWDFGLPLLIGTSRKSTLGFVLDAPIEERLEGSLASASLAIAAGADIVRAHDVRETVRAARVADAIVRANWPPPEPSP